MGKDILPLTKSEMREHRRHAQIIFQDPFSSLGFSARPRGKSWANRYKCTA